MEYEVLRRTADAVKSTVIDLIDKTDLSWNSQLVKQLNTLRNRANEVDSNAFVVIVVGPVKSGKSTFVNLLSHSKVSPTHYLECTVRPSIISQSRGDGCWITTYAPSDGNDSQINGNFDYVDLIIDAVKGLPGADMNGIQTQRYELNENNLTNQVELDLDNIMGQKTILTSITAEGGSFLGKDIYLVDMPGFDGVRANLDDVAYKTITRRADLVVFIQSSNSAISKISDEFFNLLKNGNQNVPVCLIHNYFESAFWRASSTLENKVKDQMEEAKSKIRSLGFNLSDQHCISINLGKVEDEQYVDNENIVLAAFKEDLLTAAKRFEEIEKMLYDYVSSSHQQTRLNNCLGRIKYERLRLIDMLKEAITSSEKLKIRYDEIKAVFKQLQVDEILVCKDEDFQPVIDESDIRNKVLKYQTYFLHVELNRNRRYRGLEARELLSKLIEDISSLIVAGLKTAVHHESSMESVNNKSLSRFTEIKQKLIDVIPDSAKEMEPITKFDGYEESKFDIDTSIIKATYNPDTRINETYGFNRYNEDAMCSFITTCIACVIGRIEPALQAVGFMGVLQSSIIPQVKKMYHEHMAAIINNRRRKYLDYIENVEKKTLPAIIPDLVVFEQRLNVMKELKAKLEGIRLNDVPSGNHPDKMASTTV